LLESSPVLAACRREIHRRDGADALQRADFWRLARRQVVLLSKPAGIERTASTQPVVRRGLLPGQHHSLYGLRARLRLRAAGRHALRQPLRRKRVRDRDGQRPQSEIDAGDALPLGRRGQNDGQPRQSGNLRDQRAHPRLARNEAAPSDLYRFLDLVNDPVTLKVNSELVPLKMEKGYVSIRRKWKK